MTACGACGHKRHQHFKTGRKLCTVIEVSGPPVDVSKGYDPRKHTGRDVRDCECPGYRDGDG